MMEVSRENFTQTQPKSPKEILKLENNFNISVASLGDIYSPFLKSQKEIDYNTINFEEEKSNIKRPKSSFSKRENLKNKSAKITEINLNFPEKEKGNIFKKKEYDINSDPAQKNRNIKINYLKNIELPESKKFSQVVQGLINPVKSSFSLKKITETNIKNHEKEMKQVILYPDKVNIYRKELKPIIPGQLRRSNENINNSNINKDSKNNLILIGQGFDPRKENKDNHVSFGKPNFSNLKKNEVSSAHARKTLNTSEKFFSSIDDYFISNSMKIPSKKKIDEIAKEASQLEKALIKFEDELTGKKKKKIKKFEVQYERKLREKGKKRLDEKNKNHPKIYPEIDGEYQKNIQEKLSSLQIELRQLFDQIIQEKGKGGDIEKLKKNITRAKEITKLIHHLSDDVKRGEKALKESMKKKKKSSSPSIRKKVDNTIITNKNNSMENTFNPSQSIDMGNVNNINNTNLNNNNPIKNNLYNTTNTFNPIVEDVNESNSNLQSKPNFPQSQNILKSSQNFNPMQSLSGSQNNFNSIMNNTQTSNYSIQNNVSIPNNNDLRNTQTTFPNPNLNATQSQMTQSIYSNQNNNINPLSQNINPNITQVSLSQNKSNNNIPEFTLTKDLYKTQQSYIPNSSNINLNTQQFNTNLPLNQSNITNQYNSNLPITQNFQTVSLNNSNYKIDNNQQTMKPNKSQNMTMEKSKIGNFPKTQNFKVPEINNQMLSTGVINDLTMTINHFPVKTNELKVDTKNFIQDERFSAFNVQFPVKYYYQLTKENEPPKEKDWYIRPHHTETFTKSENAIADDILNTKYISYYSPNDVKESGINKSRQEILEELISETHNHIFELQNQLKNQANFSKNGKNLYKKLENLKEEVKENYVPGKLIDDKKNKSKNIFNILKDPNDKSSYSQMFDNNESVHQTNLTIDAYGKMLEELRNKERDLLIEKRKQEYERIRPPVKNWYELKGDDFINEMMRNKMVLNAGPEYFEKINDLVREDLY